MDEFICIQRHIVYSLSDTYVKSQRIFQEFINHPYTSLCILYSLFFSFPSALEGIYAMITPSLPSSGSQRVLFVPPSTPECNLWSICVQVFVGTACRKGFSPSTNVFPCSRPKFQPHVVGCRWPMRWLNAGCLISRS